MDNIENIEPKPMSAKEHRINSAKKDIEWFNDLAKNCDPLAVFLASQAQERLSLAYHEKDITEQEYKEMQQKIRIPANTFNQFCECKLAKYMRSYRERQGTTIVK